MTKVRNSDKMNHLHLMIFIWSQSQESLLHNKRLIKSLFMSQKLSFVVLFSNPLAHRLSQHADKYILIVLVKFAETCQTMFIIHPQVVYCLNKRLYFNRTIASSIERKINERHAIGHTRKTALVHSTVHLENGLILPNTSQKQCLKTVDI
jgi:hypothetical protein